MFLGLNQVRPTHQISSVFTHHKKTENTAHFPSMLLSEKRVVESHNRLQQGDRCFRAIMDLETMGDIVA